MPTKPKRLMIEVDLRTEPGTLHSIPARPGDIVIDGDGNEIATDLDYNRRKAAIDFVDPTQPPPTEVVGDRYVLNHTPGTVHPGWDNATQGDIVEFVEGPLPTLNNWVAQPPVIGWTIYITALDYDLLFDKTSTWVPRILTGVPATRSIIAGAGLVGGGNLSVDRTIDAVAHPDGSIVVNPDNIQVGVLATDGQHGVRGGGTQHALATTLVAGFMSPADKAKLDAAALSLSDTPPVDVTKSPAAAGIATEASRQDHKHDVATATAVELTDTTNAEGAATSLARSDHKHAHGDRGGGSLHALATTLVAGFMSPADKTKLDGLTPGGGGQKTEHISIQSGDRAYSKTGLGVYLVVGRFRFRGTTVMGTPANIRANYWQSGTPGAAVWCRIQDATNNNTICSSATTSQLDDEFRDLGALSSLPAGPATFEVQVKASGGQVRIGGVIIEY